MHQALQVPPWCIGSVLACAGVLKSCVFCAVLGFGGRILVEEKPKPGFVLTGSQFRSPEKRSSFLRTIVMPCFQELCISQDVVFCLLVILQQVKSHLAFI